MTNQTVHPDAVAEPKEKPAHTLRIMDGTGDLRLNWDSEKASEIESVRKVFDEKKKKGYKAYHVKKDGEKGRLMSTFDPDAELIIMAPALQGG